MKEKIRKIHDEIKNHPYWLTFEDYLKPEIWNLFTELQSAFYSSELFHSSVVGKDEFGRYYYNNPQVCLICKTTHDFNANFHKVTKENICNYIVQLQSYLSLYHYLIDESDVAVYTFKTGSGYYSNWRAVKTEKDWGVVHTEYICNDLISTSFVDGPNGWCSPEGKIYYDLNIGKWPSYENIVTDLEILAKEFPFLKFTCTIMDRERSEEGGVPLYSFKVENGTVTLIDPIPVDKLEIKEYSFECNFDYFCANINNPNRGIYFSLNQIKELLKK